MIFEKFRDQYVMIIARVRTIWKLFRQPAGGRVGPIGLCVPDDRPISQPVPGNSEGTAREIPEECVRRTENNSLGNLVLG